MFRSDCAGSVRAGNGGIILALDGDAKDDGGSRSVRTDVVKRNQDLLNKPGSFFRTRHTARVRLAHPLIAIPGDHTVDHISKRPGNDDEGIHPWPHPGKAAKNFEGRCGFREDLPVFQQ
jgi:hypothetical protein